MWLEHLSVGMALQEVAARFVDSVEFKTLYGTNPTHADFLTKLYRNVRHRTPEQAGFDWWLAELNAARYNLAAALVSFSESPEDQAAARGCVMAGEPTPVFVLNAKLFHALVDLIKAVEAGVQPHNLTYVGRALTRAKDVVEAARAQGKT